MVERAADVATLALCLARVFVKVSCLDPCLDPCLDWENYYMAINGRPSVAWAATCCVMCAPRQCPHTAEAVCARGRGHFVRIFVYRFVSRSVSRSVSRFVSRLGTLLRTLASKQIPAI